MRLEYNGVLIEVQRVTQFDERAVYDPSGTTFLYSHIAIEVEGVLNPAATAYRALGNGPPTRSPAALDTADGVIGGETFAALDHWLMQPQKYLLFLQGGQVVVESPPRITGATNNDIPRNQEVPTPSTTQPPANVAGCDSQNGPHPIHFRVVAVDGAKGLRVRFKVETWLNRRNSDLSFNPRPAILCHRWSMSHHIARQGQAGYLTRRVIRGYAIFDAGVLLSSSGNEGNPLSPDDFRARLFHPCEGGMVRDQVLVEVSDDGLQLNYTLVDQETVTSLDPQNGITHCEIEYYDSLDTTTINASNVTTLLSDLIAGAGNPKQMLKAINDIDHTLPLSTFGLRIRLWGRRDVTRSQLITTAKGIAVGYGYDVSPVGFGRLPLTLERKRVDMVNRFIEYECAFVLSGIGGLFLGGFVGTNPNNTPADRAPHAEKIPVIGNPGGANAIGIGLPFDDGQSLNAAPGKGSRGSFVGRLAAQALLDDGERPPRPVVEGATVPSLTF